MSKLSIALGVVLARFAAKLVAGHDDRVVILNTKRKRVISGKPGAGSVQPFISHGPKVAVSTTPDKAHVYDGTPVSAVVAKLAGWRIEHQG